MTKWECEWDCEVKSNKDFLNSYEIVNLLWGKNQRRSPPSCQGEKIKYVDITSLYSWVNKTQQYPVGHPFIVITNPENQDIHAYFGKAKVDILPPHDLYHPVLPFRHGGKLTFPLCRTCMKEEMPKTLLEKS